MYTSTEYHRFHAQSKISQLQQEAALHRRLKQPKEAKTAPTSTHYVVRLLKTFQLKLFRPAYMGILLLIFLFAISTEGVVLADATNNPNTFTATLQCGSGTVTFVVLPAGSPTLLDLNSTGGFHLTQVDFTIVETGATGTVPYGAGNGQANGIQDALVTCYVTEVRDGLTFEFELTGFFTPQ